MHKAGRKNPTRNRARRRKVTHISERLRDLADNLHATYCAASTVEAALLYTDVDLDPEIAVVVKHALVLQLDKLHFEAKAIVAVMASALGKERTRRKGKDTKARK